MSAGFTRRYSSMQPAGVLAAIEGIVIIDNPPPPAITGLATGVIGMVGEFQDMTYAVKADGQGHIKPNLKPVAVLGGQDLANKLGGFDPTLGDFGVTDGNGFVSIRNKRFSSLVVQPVNLLTLINGFTDALGTIPQNAVRLYRSLPGCISATNPLPVVPLVGYTVPAATQFNDSANHRVLSAARQIFTALGHYASGVDGAVATAAAAATQTFSSAGSNFLGSGANALNVQPGDILVLGVYGSGAVTGNANVIQFRVVSVTDAHDLVVEEMSGANFAFTTTAALPWRIHHGSDADSAPITGTAADSTVAAPYTVPAKCLDATITSSAGNATALSPQFPTSSGDAQDKTWLPANGLRMLIQKGATVGPIYIAALTAPNVADSATVDASYGAAIQAFQAASPPAATINFIYSARHSETINAQLRQTADFKSSVGIGCKAIISPPINGVGATPSLVLTDVIGSSTNAVGDTTVGRDERLQYSWPGAQTYVPEAVGIAIKCADGTMTMDGKLDVTGDGWLACVQSNLPPENNPGQSADPVPALLQYISDYQRGVTAPDMNGYIALKANGICGIRIDQTLGPVFQSGVTTSLTLGQTQISRRNMADFIEDSAAVAMQPFSKLLQTENRKRGVANELDSFLNGLESPGFPDAQRISGYTPVDITDGNTPDLEEAGIFIVSSSVKTLPEMDTIVMSWNIGPGVVIPNR